MEVIRKDQNPEQDASDAPIFFGGKVTRRAIVGGGKSKDFNFNIVSFAAGARNKFHAHTSDQILYVTNGTGIVASESEEVVIKEGDTALIPSGEKRAIVGGGKSKDFNFNIVSFAAGARNKFHAHTSDQILYVTTGTGLLPIPTSPISRF